MAELRGRSQAETGLPATPAAPVSAFDGLEALAALGLGVSVVTADWRVAFANPTWLASMRARHEDVIGLELDHAFPALVATGQEELLRATAADGRSRFCRVTVPDAAPGAIGGALFDVRASRVRGGGLVLEMLPATGVPPDEEPAVRAEELNTAERAKRNFLSAISHELRTPLTALAGYGEILADEVLGEMSRAQLDIVEKMRSVTHHLTVMIDELLAYTTLEAGRESVRIGDALSGDLLRATAAIVEPLAKEKEIAFSVSMPGHPPWLRTDADKVRQILVNLAGNAVKFTDEGGVELLLEASPGEVRFHVHDSGIGIHEEDQARLFQPFGQLDNTLTRRHGGTGLGLYISSRLATLLGGRIDLDSTPGRGSTFTLVLPLRYPAGG